MSPARRAADGAMGHISPLRWAFASAPTGGFKPMPEQSGLGEEENTILALLHVRPSEHFFRIHVLLGLGLWGYE